MLASLFLHPHSMVGWAMADRFGSLNTTLCQLLKT